MTLRSQCGRVGGAPPRPRTSGRASPCGIASRRGRVRSSRTSHDSDASAPARRLSRPRPAARARRRSSAAMRACRVVGGVAAHVEVELELGLGAARAHDDARSVGQPQPQHVAGRQLVDARRAGRRRCSTRDSPMRRRMLLPQRRHDPADASTRRRRGSRSGRSRSSRTSSSNSASRPARLAPRPRASVDHAEHRDRRRDAVLVAHGLGVHEVAERLLEPEHEAGRARDPLEAGEGRVEVEPVVLGDRLQARRGDERAGERCAGRRRPPRARGARRASRAAGRSGCR